MKNALRQICSLWMLLALLTAAALPAGFMPNMAHAKGAAGDMAPIVLCTATGYTTVYVPKDQVPANQDTPAPDSDHNSTHQSCPYAPAQAAGGLPPLPVTKAPIAYRAVKVIYTAAQTLRAKWPQKHTRAQAPPRI